MADPIIRPANQSDLPGLLALYRHLHPKDPELDPSEAEAAWLTLLSSGLTTVIVADAAGSLVSSCTLAVVPNLSHGARPYGVIENVVTHSEHRRRGLGGAVLEAALAIAWDADCYKVTLATGSRRESTLRFYEGAGFLRGGKTYFEIRRL
jgi:ribosomal protein S18 acetylase RimI-like enzyme